MNDKLLNMNECHSDWIPTFLSEETEESFNLSTNHLKDTSVEFILRNSKDSL